MRKTVKRLSLLLLCLVMIFATTACGKKSKDSEPSRPVDDSPIGGNVTILDDKYSGLLTVRTANGDDKFLQQYNTESTAATTLKSTFDKKLKGSIEINAYKNEYECKQILITAKQDIESYDVTFTDLVSGSNKIDKENVELYHEYYHYVDTIYDSQSSMVAGMFPDALIPMEDAKRLGMNKVAEGKNQGVYAVLYVPKTTPAGTYSGTAIISVNDTPTVSVSVSVKVFDYTLSDSVSLMSCIPQQVGYLFNGELDNTDAMYQTYSAHLNKYRLAVQYLNSYYCGNATDTANITAVMARDTELAVTAAKDVSVSSYAIRVYEKYDNTRGRNVLNENLFAQSLRAYVDKSIQENVNLFEKAYVYMGNIIDEPELGGDDAIANANYVSGQFNSLVAQAVTYATGAGASQEMIASLQNLPHVVTGGFNEKLTGPQSYCPTVDRLGTSYEVSRYHTLRSQNKSYWWYTCTQPKIPYPTVHLDDNGVSSRVMSWMAKEYDVDGYLTWEDVFYKTTYVAGQSNEQTYDVTGMDLYDNVHRWGDAYGDGFFFYPGAPLGIYGPVDSMRLPIIRDGMEEYEALCDLEKAYAALGATYGATIDATGVMNELYASLYNDVRVYCTSDELQTAHKVLGQLLELANKGVAVSDFDIQADGKVTAKIYKPADVNVTLNGTALVAETVAEINDTMTAFVLACNDSSLQLMLPTVIKTYTVTADNIKLYNAQQKETNEHATIATVSGVSAAQFTVEQRGRISINVSAMEGSLSDGSLVLYVYSPSVMKASMSVQGSAQGNATRSLDEFMLQEGWNELRVDRLQDKDLYRLKNAQYVHLTLDTANSAQMAVSGIAMYYM